MRKALLILSLFCIVFASCKKKSSTPQATYEVDNVQDMTIQNGLSTSSYTNALSLILQHTANMPQETVAVSLSGFPSGIVVGPNELTGIPTFDPIFYFYDTTLFGAAPGVYPITITCKGTESGTKTFTFNLTVTAAAALTNTSFIGKYNNCIMYPGSNTPYADSVYIDPVYDNKVWFTNFANTGQKVYIAITDFGWELPTQTVNGYTFSSTSAGGYYNLEISFENITITNGTNTTTIEQMYMQR